MGSGLMEAPAADTAMEAARRGAMIAAVVNHLSKNRIEYAVFTLLAYSIGLLDKAMSYGQSICV
jgi:hypothetical protein